MPIYEFRCQDCDGLTNLLVRKVESEYTAKCDHCESKNLDRTITGFSYHKTFQLPPAAPRDQLLDKLASKQTFDETGIGITEEGRALMDAIKDDPQDPITSV